MNVLITGANGFVGKNLTQRLSTIKDHRDRTRPALQIEEILLCTRDTSAETLAGYCQKADFVVHLAGVNRPQDPGEFAAGNTDFTRTLLEMLRKSGNRCPVLLSSSIQASLTGRYAGNPYGQSKKAAEELLLAYGEETGAAGMIYRLPNLFGKWCRPNYNSAVATFCHHIAREELITVSDPAVELELVYIDDLIDEILDAMEGQPHRTDGAYCSVPVSHRVTLGEIVRLLQTFHDQPQTLLLPEIPEGSFEKKLYSTYLAYLPPEKIAFPLKMNAQQRIRQLMDERGWTIYRLAQESKLSQTTISNIFKRNNQPSIPTVNAICDACGITLAQFFAEDDPANTLNARSEFDNSVAALKEDQREALAAFIKTMV